MTIWIVVQLVINLILLAGLSFCAAKLFRKQEDDPRLTQGLRLLQSKIAILEDLSDHTETQVKQLMSLLDKKLQEVRGTVATAQQQMQEMSRSLQEGQKRAEQIYQEISTDQLIEKKIENKYIQAARLAHEGRSVDEIVHHLQLPRAEVELIVKVNQKKCIYDSNLGKMNTPMSEELFSRSLQMPSLDGESAQKTQSRFQQAVQDHRDRSEFRSIKLG